MQAVSNLSLEIGAGMFGLLGPNGAGKSTLMRTIATLQQPDTGKIEFNEIDVLAEPMRLRQVLGYLPQEFGVYPAVSAERLLDYFATLKGVDAAKERRQLIERMLDLTNLWDARKKHVSSFSGGMKQRFGIAQLLLNDPKLIIVDEPTAGLDPAERQRFLNLLRDVGTENTVIFSTHIVEDVKELCHEMAVMNGGKILQSGSPTDACQRLKGMIWNCSIARADLPDFEENYQVLSSQINRDNTLSIRVFSSERPSEKFTSVEPQLEDVYFSALGGVSGNGERATVNG